MRESFNAHTLDIAVMVMLTLLKTMKMMMMMMMMMMICPGCYTKLPSGTTQTFSRIFSMEKNWSTSVNYILNIFIYTSPINNNQVEHEQIVDGRYLNSCDSWGRSPVHAAATTESSMCLRILVQVLTSSKFAPKCS